MYRASGNFTRNKDVLTESSARPNYAQNFGFSTRLDYDESTYGDRLDESTSPLNYRINSNQIYNNDSCLTILGPRGRFGVSTPAPNQVALSQAPEVVNIESILTNRNVYKSKNRRNEINPIDVTQIKNNNYSGCGNKLNPNSSRLTYPTANFRELSINRFYDLNKNPQENLFWSIATDSKLEAKDNYIERIPHFWSNVGPRPIPGAQECNQIGQCPFTNKGCAMH
jgi:hypothetical protein